MLLPLRWLDAAPPTARSYKVPLQNERERGSDFAFAVGAWRVSHRRLRDRLVGCREWLAFRGEMFTRPVLGGFGNVEDNLLHHPDGTYRAIAVRSFDAKSGLWSIWWLDGRAPHQLDVPVIGRFDGVVGTFYADDFLEGVPIKIRFLWLVSNPDKPRWEQAFSTDSGVTWETNWTMDFHRANRPPQV